MGKGQTGCWWPNLNSLHLNYPTQAALWEETAGRGEKLNVIFLLHVFTPWNPRSGLFNSFKTCIPCSFPEVGSNKVTFFRYLYFTGVFFFFLTTFHFDRLHLYTSICTLYCLRWKNKLVTFSFKGLYKIKTKIKTNYLQSNSLIILVVVIASFGAISATLLSS